MGPFVGILALLLFIIGFNFDLDAVSRLGVWLVIIGVPIEIGVWICRLGKRKKPELEIGKPAQAEVQEVPTLELDAHGVYRVRS